MAEFELMAQVLVKLATIWWPVLVGGGLYGLYLCWEEVNSWRI
jgi:hypothetical protein